ncbi:MAG: helix-turn-helix domain-containing protein [Oscillospiraceae bacterium]|jgi:TPR repeat protein/transcriptional regulator with XRE-family HTH domain|nr:helix-turn-helix domain-containing protein [Oscillospiraceae bacterium]
MKLAVGDNIKRMRAEQGATQEKLADYLGVTTRAVSKWETGKAYPDITLLGGISSFFGVTIDELLCEAEKRDEKIDSALLQVQVVDNMHLGKHEENIKLLREAARERPNDFTVQMLYVQAIFIRYVSIFQDAGSEELRKDDLSEAVNVCQRVLKLCTDDTTRQTAISFLYMLFDALGDTENARAAFAKIPSFELSNTMIFPSFLTNEERLAAIQGTIKKLSDAFVSVCFQLIDSGQTFGVDYTYEQKRAILEKAERMYGLVYEDGDFGVTAKDLYNIRHLSANYSAALGDTERAMEDFELAAKYAVMYETRPLLPDMITLSGLFYTPYTSILANARRDFAIAEMQGRESNLCRELLERLSTNDTFSALATLAGETERYKAVIAELEEHAEAGRESQNPFDLQHNLERAEAGDENYMKLLGEMYWRGYGVKQDMETAAMWLRRAAERDHTGALNDLGELYRQGVGVPLDYAEAMRLFRRADEVQTPFGVGNPFSRVNIGDMYRDGHGVPRDYSEAMKWYLLAEEKQYPQAYYRLGEMYENGLGVPADPSRALEYYEKAAEPNKFHMTPETDADIVVFDNSTVSRARINEAIARVKALL